MPGPNWRAAHGVVQIPGQVMGGESVPERGDWRTQLPPGSRHRIVYKIMETLRWHHPYCGYEDMQNLERAAVVFEENIFTAATSQSDYLRKISLKMLALWKKPQNRMADFLQSNAANNSRNPQNPVVPAGTEDSDWRIRIQSDSRQRVVNKIVEILKKHVPFCGEEAIQELKDVAVRFEESVYTIAKSQSEYLRKISLKMLRMEMESNTRNPQNLGYAPL